MPTLEEAIQQLTKFAEHEQAVGAVNTLTFLVMPYAENQLVTVARNNLQSLFSNVANGEVKKGELSLADAAYTALIALAEHSPINTNDPCNLDPIPDESRIFVSTGHQFNIEQLILFHNSRNYKGTQGEFHNQKYLVNPITNLRFSPKDAAHIVKTATAKNIQILDLQQEGNQALLLQPAHAQQIGMDVIHVLNGALTGEQYQQLSAEVRQVIAGNANATRQLIQEFGATFAHIQALLAQELQELFSNSRDVGCL